MTPNRKVVDIRPGLQLDRSLTRFAVAERKAKIVRRTAIFTAAVLLATLTLIVLGFK